VQWPPHGIGLSIDSRVAQDAVGAHTYRTDFACRWARCPPLLEAIGDLPVAGVSQLVSDP